MATEVMPIVVSANRLLKTAVQRGENIILTTAKIKTAGGFLVGFSSIFVNQPTNQSISTTMIQNTRR